MWSDVTSVLVVSVRAAAFAAVPVLGACATGPADSSAPLPMAARVSCDDGEILVWSGRLLARDAAVREAATMELVEGGVRSGPVLRGLLKSRDTDVVAAAFEVIRREGPAAIPLLTEALRDKRVAVRREAISVLIDFAPETAAVQGAICRALEDRDVVVARDAARALGAMGEAAGPSVPALVRAISHRDERVVVYAAEALASIGPKAAIATPRLARAVGDPAPGIRWAACEALARIGPGASAAIPQLIGALRDEFLYVRICAAGALGSMGPAARGAIAALKEAAEDPAARAEVLWALHRIEGNVAEEDPRPVLSGDGVPWRKPAAAACVGNPPVEWDVRTRRNVAWSAELGNDTYGRPVVAGDAVYIGTDNARRHDPACQEECGVLMAFRASDGAFLWQDAAPRVKRGTGDFLLPSTTSAPQVDGERLYYMTAECQLRCLETASGRRVWELDLCKRFGVFPHEASNSEVAAVGDLLVVCTSNGQNEGHTGVPSPRAPSLVAVDRDGNVMWRANGPGEKILHGEWCSPVAAEVNGRMQVLFGGGDGWLRAYDAETGREVWRFDGNPKDARFLPRPGVFSRGYMIASPVYDEGRVFVAMGQDPSHGNGPSVLHAVSAGGQGDVTESRLIWTSHDVGRVIGTPVVHDGLLYVGDLGGTVHCLDAVTGVQVWKHETGAAIWGCLVVAGGRVYVGNEDGEMTVLKAGREEEVLAKMDMEAPLYSRPAEAGDAMYVATARQLDLIRAKP